MFFLKAQWELFGLKAPVFSWVISVGLIVWCLYVFVRKVRKSKRVASVFLEAEKKLKPLQDESPARPGVGLSLQVFDTIDDIFNAFPLLRVEWQNITARFVRRVDRDGQDRFWISDNLRNIVNEADFIDSNAFKAASSAITGVGLLATFLAILIALLDVKLTNNRVQGLDLLIQGLSGKFLSSVVALGCATFLIVSEKKVFSPMRSAISVLTGTLRGLLPILGPAQILSDLHKDISEQSNAFKIFNADLSFKLRQSFGESVGPTLERMVTAIDDLNQVLRAAEAQKRESITEQLASLLKSLERSIESSLERMGSQFNTSLTGSTQSQFDKVTESLGNTAALLKEMNTQFVMNQNVLNDLINLAKNTTSEQIANGQAQVQELTGVLKGLMNNLQEKTGESMNSIAGTLAAITLDISNKVTDLSVHMGSIIEETSERTSKTATEVLDKAGALSSRSAEQLARLLDRHSAELTRVEDLRLLLDGTLKAFDGSINRYGKITDDLKKLSSDVNIAVTAMGQIARSARDSQEAAAKVSALASGQIETLKMFTQSQKETWDWIHGTMVQYENIFRKVEGHAKDLLAEILNNLSDYSTTTQEHFNKLGTIANNHIADATGKIAGSIDELVEQLDELQTVVGGITRVVRRTPD